MVFACAYHRLVTGSSHAHHVGYLGITVGGAYKLLAGGPGVSTNGLCNPHFDVISQFTAFNPIESYAPYCVSQSGYGVATVKCGPSPNDTFDFIFFLASCYITPTSAVLLPARTDQILTGPVFRSNLLRKAETILTSLKGRGQVRRSC